MTGVVNGLAEVVLWSRDVEVSRYDALEAGCAAAGLEVRGGVHQVLAGVRRFYFDDPDGSEVEVLGPKA